MIELIDATFLQSRANVSALRSSVISIIKLAISDYQNRHAQNDDEEAQDESSDSETETEDDKSENFVDQADLATSAYHVLKEYRMDLPEYYQIRKRLPNRFDGFKVIIDLDDGSLGIRTVPGDIHGAGAHAWNPVIIAWANNNQPPPTQTHPTLRSQIDASIPPPISSLLTSTDYEWSPRGSKSPGYSYFPRDITIPPANPKPKSIRPGFVGRPYPTMVVEIAVENESWRRLKDDARTKAFSRLTSIQVFVGVKVYKNTFRAIWGKRRAVGHGMHIQQQTEKLDLHAVSNVMFTIAKSLVFWGLPLPLPPTPTPDLILLIETFRLAIVDQF